MLQPTKLVQNDDFMPGLALPGYIQTGSTNLGANVALSAASIMFTVPDGMTVEVVDAGVTCSSAETIDGSNTISLGITTITWANDGSSPTFTRDKDILAPTALTNGTVGVTESISRSSTMSFDSDSTAVNNQFGAGTVIAYELTSATGTIGTFGGDIWVRLKWVNKDNGAI